MRTRLFDKENHSSSLATLSRQMLSILVSLAIVFAAVPARAQQVAGPSPSALEAGLVHHNASVPRQNEAAESLQETLDQLRTPGFDQELSDMLSPELSLSRVASGNLEHSPSESALQETEEKEGMSTGAKVAIIAAVVVAVCVIAVVAAVNINETGSPF